MRVRHSQDHDEEVRQLKQYMGPTEHFLSCR